MPITIHCIRHGQGFHNIGTGNYILPDPRLTPLGEEQCLALRDGLFSNQSPVSLITASPMLRAIQSAYLIFQPSLESPESPKNVLALPDTQETSDDPCDIGSDPEVLEAICNENNWPIDISLIKDGYNVKTPGSRYSPSSKAITRRAKATRLFLRSKARDLLAASITSINDDPNINIVLVTHGGFLHYLTEDWENADLRPGTGWTNCETRSYTFEHEDDAEAHLIETPASRQYRGLNYPMFRRNKQRELYEETMQAWEQQGLQNPSKVDDGADERDEDEAV